MLAGLRSRPADREKVALIEEWASSSLRSVDLTAPDLGHRSSGVSFLSWIIERLLLRAPACLFRLLACAGAKQSLTGSV